MEAVMNGTPFGEVAVGNGTRRGSGHHGHGEQGDGLLVHGAKEAQGGQAGLMGRC